MHDALIRPSEASKTARVGPDRDRRIADIGEFGLIERIARWLPAEPSARVVMGIGDDVAVLDTGAPEYLLATIDAQVENVHFLRQAISSYQLGRKTAAVNLSDIASMGGTPQWALASLVLPAETEVAFVEGFYAGLRDELQEAGGVVVGGNLSQTGGGMVIDLCLLGTIAPERLILRRGALSGDMILVTGFLGDSRAGLELLRRPELPVPAGVRDHLLARHLTPRPRVREGQLLGRLGKVHAMVDVSDGLRNDLGHIMKAGGVGAEIWMDKLPLSPACAEAARLAGVEPVTWAFGGGEDYELLFTVAPQDTETVCREIGEETGTPCTVVGRVLPMEAGFVVRRSEEGEPVSMQAAGGWDHFVF